jgi:hypothetical protein
MNLDYGTEPKRRSKVATVAILVAIAMLAILVGDYLIFNLKITSKARVTITPNAATTR